MRIVERGVQRIGRQRGRIVAIQADEGTGEFVVGDERRSAGEGMVVWAPADVSHGVVNTGDSRLVLLIGIAPFPAGS